MTKVPAPPSLCQQVSLRAQQLAQETVKGYGWSQKSISAIQPLPDEGKVGLRTSAKYLMHQDRGFGPFLMTWVEGRTLPLACKRGDGPHFRRGSHVGEPGWVTIPHGEDAPKYGLQKWGGKNAPGVRVWRQQRWRHPGLKPKNFLENALQQAIYELGPSARQQLMDALAGRKPLK